MRTKLIAILLMAIFLTGCVSGEGDYQITEATHVQEAEVYETVQNVKNEEETAPRTEVAHSEEVTKTANYRLAVECAKITGGDNEMKAVMYAERITESDECTHEALEVLATSEYPSVWYEGVTSSKNNENTMLAFAKKVATLPKDEESWDSFYEQEWADKIAKKIVESDYCTEDVLKVLIGSKCRFVWKYTVLSENNTEATLIMTAQQIATLDGNWIDEEWAERLAKWVVLHDNCTDTVRMELMESQFASVWDIAMNYE